MHTFTARQVVETRAAALRSRAIRESRVLTDDIGVAWCMSADDIRWNESAQRGEARIAGLWYPLSEDCIETWAAEEGLLLSEPYGPRDYERLAAGIERARAIRARLAQDIVAARRELDEIIARAAKEQDAAQNRFDMLCEHCERLTEILDELSQPLIDREHALSLLAELDNAEDELNDDRRALLP